MRKLIRLLCCSGLLLGSSLLGAEDVETLRIAPSSVRVDGPEASEPLLVWGNLGGREWDRTTEVVYTSYPEGIVLVSALGQVTPLRDGHAEITVQHGVKTTKIPVDVSGVTSPVPVSFRRDIVPILSKAGCNAGGCHGKAEGQNGFKLSVFGFDPLADYQALTMEAHGRRVSRTTPARSLLCSRRPAPRRMAAVARSNPVRAGSGGSNAGSPREPGSASRRMQSSRASRSNPGRSLSPPSGRNSCAWWLSLRWGSAVAPPPSATISRIKT